jgi:hypothetical protein
VTITGISAGVVSATVSAGCSATAGANSVMLQVTDNTGATAASSISVNVTANPAPTLGTYGNVVLETGDTKTSTPSSAPTDNETFTTSVSSQPSIGPPGTLVVDSAGVVSILRPSTPGDFQITVTVADNCNATVTRTFTVTVTSPPPATFGPPQNVIATARTSGPLAVDVTWSPPAGVTGTITYEVQRRSDIDPNWVTLPNANSLDGPPLVDGTAQPGRMYLYRVRGRSNPFDGFFSAGDPASTITFADDPLASGTPVRALHVTQLRAAVNQVRIAVGLTAFNFTDAIAAGSAIRAIHMSELRQALQEAIGAPASPFVDATITPGVTTMKVQHIQQIRNSMK